MRVMNEETLALLLPIMEVSDAASALRLANDSPYGLNASVWSRDLPTARALARALESGSVCINDVVTSYGLVEPPFGERKSGVGRRHGPGGLRKYAGGEVHRRGQNAPQEGAKLVPLLASHFWGAGEGRGALRGTQGHLPALNFLSLPLILDDRAYV